MGKIKIISGDMRGKTITFDSSKKIRPTLGRIKETLFNWLGNDLRDLKVLDLFGGSGSLGFEANSRGAKVTIVEKDKEIFRKIKRNIEQHKMQKIDVHNTDAINFIRLVKETFDIIFLDPPFKEEKINLLVEKIKENKILKKNGIMIIHRHKKDNTKISEKMNILDERIYGISKITIGN